MILASTNLPTSGTSLQSVLSLSNLVDVSKTSRGVCGSAKPTSFLQTPRFPTLPTLPRSTRLSLAAPTASPAATGPFVSRPPQQLAPAVRFPILKTEAILTTRPTARVALPHPAQLRFRRRPSLLPSRGRSSWINPTSVEHRHHRHRPPPLSRLPQLRSFLSAQGSQTASQSALVEP